MARRVNKQNKTMKLDLTKPVQTRDGRKARIICTDAKHIKPVIALVTEPNTFECVALYGADGNFFADKTLESRNDLVNVPETNKLEGWLNVYSSTPSCQSRIHPTKEYADDCASEKRLACIDLSKLNITYTVGEGL